MTRARELAELGAAYDSGALSNRNIIINGAMQVSQRGTSESGISVSQYANAPDRFKFETSSAGTWTLSQSTTAPDGFSNSYKFDCTTADGSLSAGDYLQLSHYIEGQNLQHLQKGSSSAKKLTLSFHVRSAKTGTYIVEFYDADNSRSNSQSYTISSANTWEKKTITIDGDTSGAFGNDNGGSLGIFFYLAAGSNFTSGTLNTSWGSRTLANVAVGQVNLADSTSNDWYITGVQLEIGTEATPFEHRSFGDELARCQRYYNRSYPYGTATGAADNNTPIHHMSRGGSYNIIGQFFHPRDMRAAPTVVLYNPNDGTVNQLKGDGNSFANAAVLKNTAKGACMFVNATSITETVFLSVHATFDAEL